MLSYSDEELNADSCLMSSTSSTEVFGLNFSETNRNLMHDIYETDCLFDAIQGHSDCIQFLNFAKMSVSAELCKSDDYSSRMNTTTSRQDVAKDNSIPESKLQEKLRQCDLQEISLKLPLSLDVSELNDMPGSISIALASSKDTSMKQLRKDCERDKFVINGISVNGSEKGLEGICDCISQSSNKVLSQCCLSPIEKSLENEIAFEILRKASRTNSGGIAFQCLQYLINPDSVVIVPVSTLAKPLRISISVGSFTDSLKKSKSKDRWGLVCRVECSTYFNLKDSLHMEALELSKPTIVTSDLQEPIDVTVQLLYENEICIDINSVSKYSIQSLSRMIGNSIDSGKITMSKYEPPIIDSRK
jgi:hypothetical protein